MKKSIISFGIILAFSGYIFYQKQNPALATPGNSAIIENNINALEPTPTPIITKKYHDGTFIGSVADAYYGNVQVQAIMSNDKISKMGMPITVEIVDSHAGLRDIDSIYNYFKYIDDKFSTYKDESEITKINNGLISKEQYSDDIREVFELSEHTKAVENEGVATSGTYIRGDHIYDPVNNINKISDIISLTVVGPNIYEADRFATAAFAMGKSGINFMESLIGFEGYVIDRSGIATMTSGFNRYVI